jgi:hypothetical protein
MMLLSVADRRTAGSDREREPMGADFDRLASVLDVVASMR